MFCLVKRLSPPWLSPPLAGPWAPPARWRSASPDDKGAWNEQCRRYRHLAVRDLSDVLAASPPARGQSPSCCPVR
jgi:hypothetical protein